MKNRIGFSLLEVVIAMTIMMVVITGAVEVMISTRQLTAMGSAQDALNQEAVNVLNSVGDDLTESAWHFPSTVALPLAATRVLDRGLRYYPYVVQQTIGARNQNEPSLFIHAKRADSRVIIPGLPITLAGTPGDDIRDFPETAQGRIDYYQSYYARSQELVFLKLTTTDWAADTYLRAAPQLAFPDGDWTDASAANRTSLGILMPSGWEEVRNVANELTGYKRRAWDVDGDGIIGTDEGRDKPYGTILTAGELDLSSGSLEIKPLYETMIQPDYISTTDEPLREYMYALLPGITAQGFGRLVRAYSVDTSALGTPIIGSNPGEFLSVNAPADVGMRIDRVLSDNCVRITFDTARTDDSLSVNEVKIRLFLARKSTVDANLIITRMATSVVSMRARNSDSDVASDNVNIGNAVQFDW